MMKMTPELVAIGHIVYETIYFPDRTLGPVLGSPPAYSLVAAARQSIHCGIVTKIGNDFPPELLKIFDQVGLDTQGISDCGKSTISNLIYDKKGNKEIRFPSRALPIYAKDIPDVFHKCRMIYVCTMEDDVPLSEIANVVKYGQESAVDLGGYGGAHMSKKRRGEIDDMAKFALDVSSQFDFVKASDEDCRLIFGGGELAEMGKQLMKGKTRASIITMGSKGALLTTHDGAWLVPPLLGKPIDSTGGGDTFMAGFLSEYLRCGKILESVIFGSATALCVIENTGGVSPRRMPTEPQARKRIPDNIMELIISYDIPERR